MNRYQVQYSVLGPACSKTWYATVNATDEADVRRQCQAAGIDNIQEIVILKRGVVPYELSSGTSQS